MSEDKNNDTATEKDAAVKAALQKLQETVVSLEQQLDIEKKLRTKTEINLKSVMKQWKQVAQELSKQQTEAKPFHTVTDEYLKQLVQELRYDVRCFAETYFDDLQWQPWPQQPQLEDGSVPLRVLPEAYEQCPTSPALAQSFVWRILKNKVFDRYEWPADKSVGIDLYGVAKFLKPGKLAVLPCPNDHRLTHFDRLANGPNEVDSTAQSESLRKFHVWRSITANMVFNADTAASPKDRWRTFEDSLITRHIDPIALAFVPEAEYRRYHDLLSTIIEKALVLDREISRQAAWVSWIFEDSDCLTSQGDVNVIVAPAMVKRGKSSGDGFEEQRQLLQADTCIIQSLLSSKANSQEERGSPTEEPTEGPTQGPTEGPTEGPAQGPTRG
ncbi:hypothetical protein RRF57_004724 [Xylaria bambusicola]|uniref:Uncharacterized protein n=1 Tax=Xylaria bambusicola TaxID=326684 RepID=A0AAN7UNM5_9PEZI